MSKRRAVLSACWSCAVAIVICLLLAAAAVLATPAELIELIARSSQKGASASKAQRASELLRAGKTQEALPVLEELKNAKRSENTPEANRFATVLEHQIATLESELEQLKIAEQKALLFDPQLELLQKVVPQLSRVSEVEGTVKQFSREFEAGARDPDRFLSEIRSSQRELVDKWEKTPREKRIFVIGAGKDSAKVSKFAESLKSDGYVVFFYDFCRPLCSSQAVGAMFGTSGVTMLYRTPFAELSKYVEIEVETARFLEGLDKRVILISSSELLAPYGSKFAMRVAEMPT